MKTDENKVRFRGPKIVLNFYGDELEEANDAINVHHYKIALINIMESLRSEIKYEDNSQSEEEKLIKLQKIFREHIISENLNLDI